tara:strand:+ start:1322 stop:1516 length:195 start_codon:yes stop_codon:yes gene_type:complete
MIQKAVVNKVLEVIDKTIGKKFKIIDELTDLFQGLEPRVKKLEQKLKQIEERIDENKHSEKESS